jgi:hypothetical protein
MRVKIKEKIISHSIHVMVSILMLLGFSLYTTSATANGIQLQIFEAGLALGRAQALLTFIGSDNPNAATAINTRFGEAATAIQAAADAYPQPFNADRIRSGVDRRVIDKINRYLRRGNSMPANQRDNFARSVWGIYRQSFEHAFMDRPRSSTDQTTGYHYYPTCDLFVLDVGYQYGFAMTVADFQGSRARTAQGGANGSLRSAVLSGLKVGLNGIPYGPRNNVRKACCAFGTEAAWGTMPKFQSDSPSSLYLGYLPQLRNIVLEMNIEPGGCGGITRGTPQQLCEREHPGSVATGRDANGKVICSCPEGFFWTSDRTHCEKLIPPQQLCSRDYPGSVARGRASDGSVNCECPQGYVWNSNRTGCEKQIPPQELCTRDYPGSVARGRASDGSVNCECPQGTGWNANRTRCVREAVDMNSAECNRIIGRWKWFTGSIVDFFANNRWKTTDGIEGTWKCNPDNSIVVTPDRGAWQDTVTIARDGNSLSGRNQIGVHVSATRGGGTSDCSSCKVYEDWLYTNRGACNYHGNRLPSICDLDPECLRWNKECNRQKRLLRECQARCQ